MATAAALPSRERCSIRDYVILELDQLLRGVRTESDFAPFHARLYEYERAQRRPGSGPSQDILVHTARPGPGGAQAVDSLIGHLAIITGSGDCIEPLSAAQLPENTLTLLRALPGAGPDPIVDLVRARLVLLNAKPTTATPRSANAAAPSSDALAAASVLAEHQRVTGRGRPGAAEESAPAGAQELAQRLLSALLIAHPSLSSNHLFVNPSLRRRDERGPVLYCIFTSSRAEFPRVRHGVAAEQIAGFIPPERQHWVHHVSGPRLSRDSGLQTCRCRRKRPRHEPRTRLRP